MQNVQPSLFNRDDTFFGVCQGLGEDLGISPTWLRLAFPALLFFYPVAALATYAAAGVVVFLTRWFFPHPVAAVAVPEAETETLGAGEQAELEQVPLAA